MPPPADDERFLREACRLATESAAGGGGPFAALVVRDGELLASGTNRVVAEGDPTAHSEVVALRAAATRLARHDLSGTVVYASCEPCPMCLTAAWWARVDRIVYAATAEQAAAAGFADVAFREAVAGRAPRPAPLDHVPLDTASAPFEAWAANPDRVAY